MYTYITITTLEFAIYGQYGSIFNPAIYKYVIIKYIVLNIKTIPVNLIDIAEENVRKAFSFGEDNNDKLIKEHLSKFDLLQPVVVRFDRESKEYKPLIGRRRFFALHAKGEKQIPAVVPQLEGAEEKQSPCLKTSLAKIYHRLKKQEW